MSEAWSGSVALTRNKASLAAASRKRLNYEERPTSRGILAWRRCEPFGGGLRRRWLAVYESAAFQDDPHDHSYTVFAKYHPAQALTVAIAVSGNPAPTGTVTLASGAYTSAPAPLSNGSASISVPAGSLATGNDTLTARYAPDSASSSTYNSSTGTGSVKVTALSKITPTVTVTPSSPSVTTAQDLTVMIDVSGGNGSPAPTGTVTLTIGAGTFAPAALSNGSASIDVHAGFLAIGNHTLAVDYTPDNASSSSTQALREQHR
jgi:hypothetical protein